VRQKQHVNFTYERHAPAYNARLQLPAKEQRVARELEHPGRRSDLTPCYWGSVNRWECDENDHLNVRFYAHKINQALHVMTAGLGLTAARLPTIQTQHIRFLRESRVAAPLRVDCGVVRADARAIDLLAVMHHNVSGEVLATFLTTMHTSAAPADALAVEVPEFAAPRGIDPARLPARPTARDEALALGYRIVGRGVIGRDECDDAGIALPHAYIGRISDGMPNLWAFVNVAEEQATREQGSTGGAALEQRLEILNPLTAGTVFTQLSGLRALGSKTQQMSHLLYDESRDCLAATAEAVGVAMDLTTRKALPISPERRKRLEPLLLRG
jgi:acyl-CoA thioester hydrolase